MIRQFWAKRARLACASAISLTGLLSLGSGAGAQNSDVNYTSVAPNQEQEWLGTGRDIACARADQKRSSTRYRASMPSLGR